MKQFRSIATTDVVAVIADQELADWVGVDVSDPLLSPMAIAATAAVIEFLQLELVNRERVTTYEFWPTLGTNTGRSLSPGTAALNPAIELPYANLITVGGILVGGEATTDYRILDLPTAAIYFDAIPSFSDDVAAIVATYTAGYGVAPGDVPEVIRTAVTMAADFLYNNRGSCSAADALEKSGAAMLLTPYKAKVVII